MADDDQPSSDIDVDPSKPEGPPVTAEGKPVVRAKGLKADPPSDSSQSAEEINLPKLIADTIKQIQARDAKVDADVAQTKAEQAPVYAALRKEMEQPLPQMPSMEQPSPYGPPPTVDQQTQRGGILGTILYGIIGLGLAKVFAGRNKSAYFGALEGLGDALQKRNAGQEKQSEQSFDRWIKLNELWRQQVRDRVEDYNTAINNRRLSEQQKLELLGTIANQHGNVQTEAAAYSGNMERVIQLIEQANKMQIAQSNQTWKIIKSKHGNSDADRAYESFLQRHGYNPDTQWDDAQRNPDTNYEKWLDKRETQIAQQKKTGTGETVPELGGDSQEEINKHIDGKIDRMIAPAAP